ncbi:hypothetical protein L6452_41327 [Arctium lappa]|uniref:Uncharacterized protein n=1 Tax=Arctium lappa TaxID=4217 RepID=A0ACB8XNT1_ARCLA|nr:hypothetical protein L6452_41327 [Arctium lappa]
MIFPTKFSCTKYLILGIALNWVWKKRGSGRNTVEPENRIRQKHSRAGKSGKPEPGRVGKSDKPEPGRAGKQSKPEPVRAGKQSKPGTRVWPITSGGFRAVGFQGSANCVSY